MLLFPKPILFSIMIFDKIIRLFGVNLFDKVFILEFFSFFRVVPFEPS